MAHKPVTQRKNYFTFGRNHTHPVTGEKMADYWIVIIGRGQDARQWMVKTFGAKWSMHYGEDEFTPEYFPKGQYKKVIDLTK